MKRQIVIARGAPHHRLVVRARVGLGHEAAERRAVSIGTEAFVLRRGRIVDQRRRPSRAAADSQVAVHVVRRVDAADVVRTAQASTIHTALRIRCLPPPITAQYQPPIP